MKKDRYTILYLYIREKKREKERKSAYTQEKKK